MTYRLAFMLPMLLSVGVFTCLNYKFRVGGTLASLLGIKKPHMQMIAFLALAAFVALMGGMFCEAMGVSETMERVVNGIMIGVFTLFTPFYGKTESK
jgi:hypothetical protein